MASNFFEASTIFKSPELKMKFMNFLSTTICQKHNIQSLVELDYGKHIIHDKILSQVHSRIISIPLTLTFEGSINNMTQYQAPICIPLQEILDSMLEQSHNMLMAKSEQERPLPLPNWMDISAEEHGAYEEAAKNRQVSSDNLKNFYLSRVMLLGLEFHKASNQFPIHVGIRTNAAQESHLLRNEVAKKVADSAFDVILKPYANLDSAPKPFLSTPELEKRKQSYLKYGPCKNFDNLMEGGIVINQTEKALPMVSFQGERFSDDLLLMPTQSLLVDIASELASNESPILHLKTKDDQPSVYSLMPLGFAKSLFSKQEELVEHAQNLTSLWDLQFYLCPIQKTDHSGIQNNFNQVYRDTQSIYSTAGELVNQDHQQALDEKRQVTVECHLKFMAVQTHHIKSLNDEKTIISSPEFFLPSEEVIIKVNID